MKLIKMANGKVYLRISKKEWDTLKVAKVNGKL